jgi:hypothetical protein
MDGVLCHHPFFYIPTPLETSNRCHVFIFIHGGNLKSDLNRIHLE